MSEIFAITMITWMIYSFIRAMVLRDFLAVLMLGGFE